MQNSKAFIAIQGFYCMLYFGLPVHVKRKALGPVSSLKKKYKTITFGHEISKKSYFMYLGQIFNFRSCISTLNWVNFYLFRPQKLRKIHCYLFNQRCTKIDKFVTCLSSSRNVRPETLAQSQMPKIKVFGIRKLSVWQCQITSPKYDQ